MLNCLSTTAFRSESHWTLGKVVAQLSSKVRFWGRIVNPNKEGL